MTTRMTGILLALSLAITSEAICSTLPETNISDDRTDNREGRKKYSRKPITEDNRPSHDKYGSLSSPDGSPKAMAEEMDDLSQKEREIIHEINMVRTDPAMYARKHLAPMRDYYRGNLLQYPGAIAIRTQEGGEALEECIRELENAKPSPPLSPQKGLLLAARDHVADQAQTGATGHTGGDGSSVGARLNRYGKWSASAGENIDYGSHDARRIVASLLIDDGVPSRGHRKNLLDGRFHYVGVAVGSHPEYRNMCVMDFAGAYKSN